MANKKFLILILLLAPFFSLSAQTDLSRTLAGRILLQVEENGEAWYVDPDSYYRYYLGRPDDAWQIMKGLGLGISNEDLNKIPIGLLDYGAGAIDADVDGLPDLLETALGTDKNSRDSDNDGYTDKTEVFYGYNPLGPGKTDIDFSLAEKQKGKILLQTEKNGEAWYVNPLDKKRYYLMRPADAFTVMRQFGLGISNENLATIPQGEKISDFQIKIIPAENTGTCQVCGQNQSAKAVFDLIIASLEKGETQKIIDHIDPDYKTAAEYNLDYIKQAGMDLLAEFMKNSTLKANSAGEMIYTTKFNSSLGETTHDYIMKKQPDGSWKLANF